MGTKIPAHLLARAEHRRKELESKTVIPEYISFDSTAKSAVDSTVTVDTTGIHHYGLPNLPNYVMPTTYGGGLQGPTGPMGPPGKPGCIHDRITVNEKIVLSQLSDGTFNLKCNQCFVEARVDTLTQIVNVSTKWTLCDCNDPV